MLKNKTKKILIGLGATTMGVAGIASPIVLTSCSNEALSDLLNNWRPSFDPVVWNEEDQYSGVGYNNTENGMTVDQLSKQYLEDIKKNPKIFADEIKAFYVQLMLMQGFNVRQGQITSLKVSVENIQVNITTRSISFDAHVIGKIEINNSNIMKEHSAQKQILINKSVIDDVTKFYEYSFDSKISYKNIKVVFENPSYNSIIDADSNLFDLEYAGGRFQPVLCIDSNPTSNWKIATKAKIDVTLQGGLNQKFEINETFDNTHLTYRDNLSSILVDFGSYDSSYTLSDEYPIYPIYSCRLNFDPFGIDKAGGIMFILPGVYNQYQSYYLYGNDGQDITEW